jgi:hypothetical protein
MKNLLQLNGIQMLNRNINNEPNRLKRNPAESNINTKFI